MGRWSMHAFLVCAVGCGPGPDTMVGPTDGGDGGDGGADASSVPYDIPWLTSEDPVEGGPVEWPCPEGWRTIVSEHGTQTCSPWPETGRATCPPPEVHLPGTPGCTRIGSVCPADGLPAALPADAPVVYVSAAATAPGDGSRAAPYPTLGDAAILTQPAGTIVAVGAGRYDEPVVLPAGVTLWGACVTDTELVTSTPDLTAGVITLEGGDATVRNLRIGSSPRPGIWVPRGATLEARDLWLEGLEATGITVHGGNITAEGLVVRSTQARRDEVVTTDGESGNAVAIMDGGSGTLSRMWLEDNREYSVLIRGPGTTVTVTDSVVEGTREKPCPPGYTCHGQAIQVEYDAVGTVLRSSLADSFQSSALVYDARLVIEDTVCEGGRYALIAEAGSEVEMTRVRMQRQRAHGVMVKADTLLRLTDATILETNPEGTQGLGAGLYVLAGGRLEATRTEVSRAAALGIAVGNELARSPGDTQPEVTLTDVLIRAPTGETPSIPGHRAGGGVVLDGCRATVNRLVVTEAHEAALYVVNGTELAADDILITDTLDGICFPVACSEPTVGAGVGVYWDGSANLRHFSIRDSHSCGLHLAEGGQADLHDGTISHTPIGVCLQVDGYDISRLQDGVTYRENDLNLDATELPIPAIGSTPEF